MCIRDSPNILPAEEYQHRLREQRRLLRHMVLPRPIALWEGPYEPDAFLACARGLEQEPEGGRRCTPCFALRLQHTAETASAHGFDFFTTTLSVSPHKNAALINEIGAGLQTDACRDVYKRQACTSSAGRPCFSAATICRSAAASPCRIPPACCPAIWTAS